MTELPNRSATTSLRGSPEPAARGLAIDVRGLRKSFGKSLVLDGIDLAVPPARSLPCSGRTAPARPRPCTSSPLLSGPTAAPYWWTE